MKSSQAIAISDSSRRFISRRDRFEKVRDGHFWLSETPEVVGSNGWAAALTRMATCVQLKARAGGGSEGGTSFFVFNTHYDHKGVKARPEDPCT